MEAGIFQIPIANALLDPIVARLANHDVFTPSWDDSVTNRYDPGLYLRERQQFGTQVTFLVDRNVLTRLAGLSAGRAATEQHQTAAAILAFAPCCDVVIEPNIALYELAAAQGNDAAIAELAAFRLADYTHPGLWADVAAGVVPSLEAIAAAPRPGSHDVGLDFTMPLRSWKRNYILALKLGSLALDGGNAVERMSRLMDWAFTDFALRGPALLLAARYLAPRAVGKKRMLKDLKDPNRELAINGLRNAAWDLTYISEWLKRFDCYDSHQEATVLVSMDKALHALARATIDADRQPTAFAQATLTRLWGERDGRQLAKQLAGHYASLEDPSRQVKRSPPPDYIGQLIREGEAAIRASHPR